MGLALLYPEATPGKKTKGSATALSETNKVSTARISQARAVLRHSPELAAAVRDATGGSRLRSIMSLAAVWRTSHRAAKPREPEPPTNDQGSVARSH